MSLVTWSLNASKAEGDLAPLYFSHLDASKLAKEQPEAGRV